MNRKSLLETLDLVRPALSDDGLVPIFTNFCFEENTVYAFKDRLGIMAPCEVTDTFAVQGKTLIELLKTFSTKDVDLDLDSENVVIKSGKSRMKLPFLSKSEFLFEEPESEEWEVILDLDEQLINGIQLCLITASSDNTMPAFMGVTIKGRNETYLYSCDGDALSRFRVDPGVKGSDAQYTIPNDFCDAVIRIAEKTGFRAGQLYVNSEWVIAEFGNNYKVFGRIIENPEPLDFEKQIKRVIKDTPSFVSIPDGLASALNRARIVADPENKATLLTVEGNKLLINTETHIGVVTDTLKLKGHGDVEASVSAKLISRALDVCDEFSLFDNCTVYRQGEDFTLLVANYQE